MDAAPLLERVVEHLRSHARQLGLSADRLQVEPVLNWGGFVNRSFHIQDGRRRLHLKVTDEGAIQSALRRWRKVHRHLEQHYHAPPLLDWVAIPDTGFAGLLFEHVEGDSPKTVSAGLAAQVGTMLQTLHSDRELARVFPARQQARSCLDSFSATYLTRFRADLEIVRANPPEFVDAGLIDWLEAEIAGIERAARQVAAFHEPAASPVHGDLWAENILVKGGRWHLLDWDNLALGDPVTDLVALVGPTRHRLRAPEWLHLSGSYHATRAARDRFAVYARARLLDWVLDPLADHVDADSAGDAAGVVRVEKERIHREALLLYRRVQAPR